MKKIKIIIVMILLACAGIIIINHQTKENIKKLEQIEEQLFLLDMQNNKIKMLIEDVQAGN